MTFVNVISTILVFLLFYLTAYHSKKEKRASRVLSLFHNLLFYIAQIHFGSLGNVVVLFPFPGVYCIGFASKILSTFWLGVIWVVVFALFLITMLIEVLIRLNAVARPGRFFDFKLSTYTWLVALDTVFLFVPAGLILTWFHFFQTDEIVKTAVREFWPNCIKVFDHPGTLIFTYSHLTVLLIFLLQLYVLVLVSFYFPFFFGVVYELKQQSLTTSAAVIRFHMKVFKDTITQNAIRIIFLIVPIMIVLLNFIIFQPEDNTIIFTTLITVMFTSAPIPCTVLIFIQKKSFHPFFRSKLLFWKSEETMNSGNFERRYLQNTVIPPLNS